MTPQEVAATLPPLTDREVQQIATLLGVVEAVHEEEQ